MNTKLLIVLFGLLTLIILIVVAIGIRILPEGVTYCNAMLGLDYGAAADGPYYYVELPTFNTISECGGSCMVKDCSNICPPPKWTCN